MPALAGYRERSLDHLISGHGGKRTMPLIQALSVKFDQVRKGHSVDALAYRGDEGRGTLRKVLGSCEQTLIQEYPNGATHLFIGILW